MSACAVLSPSAIPTSPSPRKRTTSFSFSPTDEYHRPAKAPRTGSQQMGASSLRRSESVLLLPTPQVAAVPYSRTLSFYKEQRQRRKMNQGQGQNHRGASEQLTIRTTPSAKVVPPSPMLITRPAPPPSITTTRSRPTHVAPSKVIMPSVARPFTTYETPRRSSPLSPNPIILPGRPVFPRSKPCLNLHRVAIKMRMLSSEEGQRILSLGPRLAMEIMQTSKDILRVTRELEDMVGGEDVDADADAEGDDDVVMADATATPDPETPASSPIEGPPPTTSPSSVLTSPPTIPATPHPASQPLPPLSPLLASYTPSPSSKPSPSSSSSSPTPAPPVLTTSWVVVKGEDWEMVDCAA